MRQLVYQVCYTRYQVSFYLWWIVSVLKYCKVPKYYDQIVVTNQFSFLLCLFVFMILIITVFSYLCTYLLCVKYWNCLVMYVAIYYVWNIEIAQLRVYAFVIREILELFSYACTHLLCVKYWNCSVTHVRIYYPWNIGIVQLRMYAFIMREILKLFRIYVHMYACTHLLCVK